MTGDDQTPEILTTGAELYRVLKTRGLELRRTDGRDQPLFERLCTLLECRDRRLQRFLDQKGTTITAEKLASALLETAKPFALMYRDIWQALQAAMGTAAESVRIAIDQHLLPFDTFRRQAMVSDTAIVPFAPETLLVPDVWDLLTSIPRELGSGTSIASRWFRNRSDIYYRIGSEHELPRLDGDAPGLVREVHGAFSEIIRRASDRMTRLADATSGGRAYWPPAQRLTDLMPAWTWLFENWGTIDDGAWHQVFQRYEAVLGPHRSEQTRLVARCIDVLDLPLWRHRWRVYEIWCTVVAIETFRPFRPRYRVDRGTLEIGRPTATTVAEFVDGEGRIVQFRTQVLSRTRSNKGAMPDLKITQTAGSGARSVTPAVIECKQRKRLERAHVSEVGRRYVEAEPTAQQVFILSYDRTGAAENPVEKVTVMDGFEPLNVALVAKFSRELADIFHSLRGFLADTCLLVDISASTGGSYGDEQVRDLRDAIVAGVEVYRFAEELIDQEPLVSIEAQQLASNQGTDTPRALQQVLDRRRGVKALLVVTDGGSPVPADLQKSIACYREAHPRDLRRAIAWLVTNQPFDAWTLWREDVLGVRRVDH